MNERLHDRLNEIGIVVGIIMMFVGLIGEALGWFDELGMALTIVGTALGVLNAFDRTGRKALIELGHLSTGQKDLGRVVKWGNEQLADEIRSGTESVVHEIRSGNELVVQEIRSGNELVVQEIRSGNEKVVHEIRVGNRTTWERLDEIQSTLDARLPGGSP